MVRGKEGYLVSGLNTSSHGRVISSVLARVRLTESKSVEFMASEYKGHHKKAKALELREIYRNWSQGQPEG
jgi:hypothetical protein